MYKILYAVLGVSFLTASGCGGYITKFGDSFVGHNEYHPQPSTTKGGSRSGSTAIAPSSAAGTTQVPAVTGTTQVPAVAGTTQVPAVTGTTQVPVLTLAESKEQRAENSEWAGRYVRNTPTTYTKGDYISVNLKSAYIYSFPEGVIKRSANSFFGWIGNPSPVRGQVAILANVYEGGFQDNYVSNSNGRVIYYSNDVYEGQVIEDSFAPVYGPVIWNGNPLTIKVVVMELDQEDNNQFKQVLDAVASVGKRVAGPGADQLISGLSQIGDALVASNGDDVMAKSKATFVPVVGAGDFNLPVLASGDIIFARVGGDRKKPIKWEDHCYNELYGLVQKKPANHIGAICNGSTQRQPDFSYYVLSIGKNLGTVDMTPTAELRTLQQDISQSLTGQSVKDSAQVFVSAVERNSVFKGVSDSIDNLGRPDAKADYKYIEGLSIAGILQCGFLQTKYGLPLSSTEKPVVVKVCGEKYESSSLSSDQYSYAAKKLVAMSSCVTAAEITDQSFILGDKSESGMLTAKKTIAEKLKNCN